MRGSRVRFHDELRPRTLYVDACWGGMMDVRDQECPEKLSASPRLEMTFTIIGLVHIVKDSHQSCQLGRIYFELISGIKKY